MLKAIFIVCFLLAVSSYAKLTPSDDFNITDFVGNWNVVGFFSTENLELTFYSCATLNVTLGTLSRLTLSLTYVNGKQYQVVKQSSTVVPSPLNKADLISTTAPTPQNNYVVVYYNTTSGEAILINSAVTLGYILSRNDNPQNNNFEALATEVLTNNSVPTSNVTYIFNKNCEYGSLKGLTNFDPIQLAGEFYGNAVFTTEPLLQDLKCFTTEFAPSETLGHVPTNIITNFTFNDGKIIYAAYDYISLPQLISVLVNTGDKDVPPLVLIYANNEYGAYLFAAGDSTKAFLFSPVPPVPNLPDAVITEVKQILNQNGLIVSSSTFYLLNSTCQMGDVESIMV